MKTLITLSIMCFYTQLLLAQYDGPYKNEDQLIGKLKKSTMLFILPKEPNCNKEYLNSLDKSNKKRMNHDCLHYKGYLKRQTKEYMSYNYRYELITIEQLKDEKYSNLDKYRFIYAYTNRDYVYNKSENVAAILKDTLINDSTHLYGKDYGTRIMNMPNDWDDPTAGTHTMTFNSAIFFIR